MGLTIIILAAVVICLVYGCLVQARKFDNVHSQLLDAETARLQNESCLYDCEKKLEDKLDSINRLGVSNQKLDNLAVKYSNALGRSNSKLNDIETALAGVKNDNISKTIWAGVEVAEMIDKLESILEEK